MTTVATYPHIAAVAGESPRLKSHPRTRVAMIVMDYRGRGLGPEEIARHYPYLTLAEIHSAMAYYYDYQNEIDAEIQAELDQLVADPSPNLRSPVWNKLKDKGAI